MFPNDSFHGNSVRGLTFRNCDFGPTSIQEGSLDMVLFGRLQTSSFLNWSQLMHSKP